MWEYQNHNVKMKTKDLAIKAATSIIFLALIASAVLLFTGCAKYTNAEKKTVCLDNYWYDVVPNKSKVILKDENGHFMKCSDSEIF